MMTETCLYCDRCHERLVFVTFKDYDNVMLRPYRTSKCKRYRSGKMQLTCRGLAEDYSGAVAAFEHCTVVEPK